MEDKKPVILKPRLYRISLIYIMENTNKWPDATREFMIEKSKTYENQKDYNYGFYDGYQKKSDEAEKTVIVVWKDGTWKQVSKESAPEYQNDDNWLTTVNGIVV